VGGQRDELGQRLGGRIVPARHLGLLRQREPVEAVGRQGEHVGQFADGREGRLARQLDRHRAAPGREVQLHGLRGARQVRHAQKGLVLELAHIGEDLAVARVEEAQGPAPEGAIAFSHRDQAAHPVQERGGVGLLRLHVHGLEAVDGVHDGRQVELLRVGAREAAVAVGRPLHRRPHPVAVAEVVIVAHAQLVAVIDDRRAGHRHQEPVHQLDLAPVVLHQRREAPADA
jgi:hypothetical protein